MAIQKPELSAEFEPSAGALFSAAEFTVGDVYDLEADAPIPIGVLGRELRAEYANSTIPQRLIVANQRLKQLAERPELDERPELRYPTRSLIAVAIQVTSGATGKSSVDKAQKGRLYLQAHDLLATTQSLGAKGLNLWDHYPEAVSVAEIYCNSQDIATAMDTTERFIEQRRRYPNMLMGETHSRSLQRELVRLCDMDQTKAPIELMCRNAIDIYQFGLLRDLEASDKKIIEELAEPREAIPATLLKGVYATLISNLVIGRGRSDLLPRVLSYAEYRGIELGLVALEFQEQLEIQGPGSNGQQDYLQLIETLGRTTIPLLLPRREATA